MALPLPSSFAGPLPGWDARPAGSVIMITLVVDAFTDPMIGHLSHRTSLGRRHPFMYAAAAPVALCYLCLFSPPQPRQTRPRERLEKLLDSHAGRLPA